MFEAVTKKLERTEYFLNNIKDMALASGGLPHVKATDQNKLRANLDAFFFELLSSKDIFLQRVNDKYAHLRRKDGTKIGILKPHLVGYPNALAVVEAIEKEMSQGTWLWILNNYRNAATHCELLGFHYEAGRSSHVEAYLHKNPEDPSQGHADIEVIPYCEQSLSKMKAFLDERYSQLHITS